MLHPLARPSRHVTYPHALTTRTQHTDTGPNHTSHTTKTHAHVPSSLPGAYNGSTRTHRQARHHNTPRVSAFALSRQPLLLAAQRVARVGRLGGLGSLGGLRSGDLDLLGGDGLGLGNRRSGDGLRRRGRLGGGLDDWLGDGRGGRRGDLDGGLTRRLLLGREER